MDNTAHYARSWLLLWKLTLSPGLRISLTQLSWAWSRFPDEWVKARKLFMHLFDQGKLGDDGQVMGPLNDEECLWLFAFVHQYETALKG